MKTLLLILSTIAFTGFCDVINVPRSEEPTGLNPAVTERKVDPQAAQHRELAQAEARFGANPTDASAGLKLVTAYLQLRRTNDAHTILNAVLPHIGNDLHMLVATAQAYSHIGPSALPRALAGRLELLSEKILADPQARQEQLQAALQAYQLAGNIPRMTEIVTRLTKLDPTRPELWYDLGALLSYQNQTNAALAAVSNAVWHSEARLRLLPTAMDLRRLAATDLRFRAIQTRPEFQKLVAPKP